MGISQRGGFIVLNNVVWKGITVMTFEERHEGDKGIKHMLVERTV